MAVKITISFKENEQRIIEHLNKKLSKSNYIKELILKDMQGDTKKNESANKLIW